MATENSQTQTSNTTVTNNSDPNYGGTVEEGWMKSYWRPAMAFVYMAICVFDFIIMPVWVQKTEIKPTQAVELVRKLPEKDQVAALTILTKDQYWNPITLKENGFIHIAFGFILGIAAWTRGQAQIAQIKQQQ